MDDRVENSLAAQIVELEVGRDHLAIWALGQHGFLLKGGGHTIVLDPYLSNYVEELSGGEPRLAPIVIQPEEMGMVDVVLVTHGHPDHCDPQTLGPLLEAAPRARLLTSYKARQALVEAGFDASRIDVPIIDQPVDLGRELSVTPIPAAHYEMEPDANGNPAYLGFILTLNGVTLYHSGDTRIYPGLVERLQAQPLDVMCLPINGGDWFRDQEGLVGNMDYREAADLTAKVGGRVLLPAHNDMFAGNRINPSYLLDYLETWHSAQRVHFLRPGELYYYVR